MERQETEPNLRTKKYSRHDERKSLSNPQLKLEKEEENKCSVSSGP